MSDHAILEEDDGLEFHASFNLALDGAGFEVFKWLIIGHILYAIGLLIVVAANITNGNIWVTPLFALPLLWRTRDYRMWQKVVVLLVGFTAMHYFAVQAAVQVSRGQEAWVPGLLGGAIGAIGAFALCGVFGLLRSGPVMLIFAVFWTIVLALVGSMGVYLYLTTGAKSDGMVSAWVQMLKIYTPWQVVFAYALAKMLRPDG